MTGWREHAALDHVPDAMILNKPFELKELARDRRERARQSRAKRRIDSCRERHTTDVRLAPRR